MTYQFRDFRRQQPLCEKDPGLATFMRSVFAQLAASVVVSGVAAFGVQQSGALQQLLVAGTGLTGLGWFVVVAPVGLVLLLGGSADRMGGSMARAVLALYALLVGLSLGALLLGVSDTGILATFAAAAGAFAALAFAASRSSHDLSRLGAFLTAALVGLIIALVLNIFLQSTVLDWGLSAIGILIFSGLTAYDVQRLQKLYQQEPRSAGAQAAFGALMLYMDLLNLFLSLLRFTGRRK